MKVGTKLLSGFLAMTLLGITLGIAGIATIRMLSVKAEELNARQVCETDVSNVLNAHFTWRYGLTVAVLTGGEFAGSRDSKTCALGKWLASDEAKGIADPEVISLLNAIHEPHDYIHSHAQEALDSAYEGNMEKALSLLENDIFPRTQEVIDKLGSIEEHFTTMNTETRESIFSTVATCSIVIYVLVSVNIVVGILLSVTIPKSIVKPLGLLTIFMKKASTTGDITLEKQDEELIGRLSDGKHEIAQCLGACTSFVGRILDVSAALETISHKDLSSEFSLLSEKDTMGQSLNMMLNNFNTIFNEINDSTAHVATGSKQIADGAQALAQGSTEQAASVQELSSSISAIAQKTKENAALAERSAVLANTIKSGAENGSRQMDEMMAAVKEINQASHDISKVIKVIDDIAFQTNILALNAAVEAARAGAAGKGFAVVAEEVRNLAAKSAEAAKNTGGLITNSIEKAELGSRIAGATAASLAEIVSGISESSKIASDIAISSDEQYAGITQINIGVDQVAQVVQLNSATAEESAAASEEMSEQSKILEKLITEFKLKNSNRRSRSLESSATISHKQLAVPIGAPHTAYSSSTDFGKY
ncbi:MAG: methyl-accepting chemotaxis protein [Oscillospiraceae bacterium]|jgi:methyl-accepting chemotaxis protein|nr:methyl-accepting chemotaxis protein [Oscillospiraceae bacterium]